jgi:hypothetical protein
MGKAILQLTLPHSEERSGDDALPSTSKRVLSVENKMVAASARMLELRGIGDWALLGSPETVRAGDIKGAMRDFLKALTEHGDADTIDHNVQGRRAAKVRARKELLEAGGISRTGSGNRSDPYLYRWEWPEQSFPGSAPADVSSTLPGSLGWIPEMKDARTCEKC